MKCSKCKTKERHGSLAYCSDCNAEYMKEYRAKKLSKMQEKPSVSRGAEITKSEPFGAVNVEDKVIKEREVGKSSEPVHPALKNPLYLSYYVWPGTQLHKELIEAEKKYLVEGRI